MGTPVAGYANGSDSLLRFRTAYLRAIALGWQDKKFLEMLCKSNNILDDKFFQELMPDGKPLPWSVHIKIHFDPKHGPTWLPGVSAGWVGGNDLFEILLPPKPDNPKEYSIAAANYFNQFPTLLGYRNLIPHNPTPPTLDGSASDFVNFSNVLLEAIVLSWNQDDKTSEKPQINIKNIRTLLIDDGISVLSDLYGFNNPWNFDFKFIAAEDVDPNFIWNPKTQSWGNLYNTIILNFPNQPRHGIDPQYEPELVDAIALSRYNISGAHYPFSCP